MLNTNGKQAAPESSVVVYDGECARCRRWVTWARSRVVNGRLQTLPLQDRRALEITGRSRRALLRAVHVVRPDGTVVDGAAAVLDVLRYLRGGRLFAWLFGLPGAFWVIAHAYGWVAGRRATGTQPIHANGNTGTDSRCAGVP